jgi:hypothetical protein
MANRFQQPIASEFINTYVPIPFKEMMMAGQMKQERYDKTAAAIDSNIQRMEMLDAVPGSPDEAFRKDQVQKMYDIRDRYITKDLSDPFVYRQMNNDINTGLNKNRIKDMQENAANYKETEKMIQELSLKGLYNPELNADKASLYDSSNGVRKYTPSAYIPKEEVLDKYFDEIKEPGYKGTIQDPNNINYGMQIYATDDKDIQRVIGSRANEYAATVSGQQEIQLRKNTLKKQGVDISKVSDVDLAKDIMNEVGQRYKRQALSGTRAAANLRDSGGSKTPNPYQSMLENIMAGSDVVAGGTPDKKIKSINSMYDEAQTALAAIKDQNSPEAAELRGTISKIDEARTMGRAKAQEVVGPQIEALKKETMSKLKSIPQYTGVSEQDLSELIESKFNPGFVGGLNRVGEAAFGAGQKVFVGVPTQVGGFLVNAVNNIVQSGNQSGTYLSVAQALEENPLSENWTIGEVLKLIPKIVGKQIDNNNAVHPSKAMDKLRDKTSITVFRDLVKETNRYESQIEKDTDEYVLGQMQHIVSRKQQYPIVTTDSGNGEVITSARDGRKTTSNITRVLNNLPLTMASFEISEADKKGKYGVLDKKDAVTAQSIIAGWEKIDNPFVESETDDQGRMILNVGFKSPKSTDKATQIKQYQIKIPADSDEARKVAADFMALETPEATVVALKLLDPNLKQEVNRYVDVPEGHDFTMPRRPDDTRPPETVNVKRTNGEYIITINGKQAAPRKYKEQVIDALYQLKAKSLLGE